MNKINAMVPVLFLLIAVLGCASETKKETLTSGRLKFVKTLKYGSVGTHGGQGWYVSDRGFEVNGRSWKPSGIYVKDHIADCEASPNSSVEAVKCYSFADSKELVYILTMKGDKPDWSTASDMTYRGGKNLGEWTGDGRWVLFKDHLFNVESSEIRKVVGLPDFPEDFFRGASPDLQTIIYDDYCFPSPYDSDDGPPPSKIAEARCKAIEGESKRNSVAFWLIDVGTGDTKIIEFPKSKYDWLVWDQKQFPSKSNWAKNFQNKLVWEKDKSGKYNLTFPN